MTYFFNGGEKHPFPGEEQLLIASPREVATYDQKPQMSAPEVCHALLEKLEDKSFSVYVVNFANTDMVGHTGNYEAAVKSVEAVDACLQLLVAKCAQENVTLIVTADHGNADQMAYPDGMPHTSHTDALVPFIVVHPLLKNQQLAINPNLNPAALKDVAPTMLSIIGLSKPTDFTGEAVFL